MTKLQQAVSAVFKEPDERPALDVSVPPGKYNVARSELATKRVTLFVFPEGLSPSEAREVASEMRELLTLVEEWGN